MLEPKIEPKVMCAECQHIFAPASAVEDEVTCPVCAHTGEPGRIMKITGFPDVETFKRNWQKAKAGRDQQ